MTSTIFLPAFLTLVALVVLSIVFWSILRSMQGRACRRELQEEGRVRGLDQLSREELEGGYFLVWNSRSGLDTWWMPEGTEPAPTTDGTFEKGLLITPNPRFKELKRFCEERRIKLKVQGVKH